MPRALLILLASCLSAIAEMPAWIGFHGSSRSDRRAKNDGKWMFTFIPVGDTTGLRYSEQLRPE